MQHLRELFLGFAIGGSYTKKIKQRERFFDACIQMHYVDDFKIHYYDIQRIKYSIENNKITKEYSQLNEYYVIEDKNSLMKFRDKITECYIFIKSKHKIIFFTSELWDYKAHFVKYGYTQDLDQSKYFQNLNHYMDGRNSSGEIDPFSILESLKEIEQKLRNKQRSK